MSETVKWYKKEGVAGAFGSLLGAVIMLVSALTGWYIEVAPIVGFVMSMLGANNQAKTAPIAKPKPKATLTGIVFAGLLCLGACAPYTYEGRTSHTSIEGHGPNGTHVVVTVDKAGVCTVTGEASTLVVDEETAMRICADHDECTWRTAK